MSDKLAQQFVHRLLDAQAELAMLERDIALSIARRDALIEYIAASERIAEELSTRRSDLDAVAIRIGKSLQDVRTALLDHLTPEGPPQTAPDVGKRDAVPGKAPRARFASTESSPVAEPREGGKAPARQTRRSSGRRREPAESGDRPEEEGVAPASLNKAERAVLDLLHDQPKLLGIGDITEEVGVRLNTRQITPPLRAVLQSLQRRGLVERVGHKWRTTQRDGILDALFTR